MIFDHQITFVTDDKKRYDTWFDWKLVPTERPYVTPPALKSKQTSIDAADGKIDQTESLTDHPVFDNRTGSWTFYVMNNGVDVNHDYGTWFDRYSKIANTIHGKKVKVFLNDDPDFYYDGRVTVNSWANGNTWSQIQIGYEFFPYKLSVDEYDTDVQEVNGTAYINVVGSEMPVAPRFTVVSREYIFNPNQAATRAMIVQFLYKYHMLTGTDDTPSGFKLAFIDVPDDAYYKNALRWANNKGYIAGYSKDLFIPNNPCTRGQFVQILWKYKGSPTVKTDFPFTDVKKTDYYYKAVRWAFANGYISGTSATTFTPNQSITRAQAVYILWCLAGGKSGASGTNVTLPAGEDVGDVSDSVNNKPWYYDAVKWAYTHHYVAGTTSTTFDPGKTSTRGHFFTIVYAWYCGRQTNKPFDGSWVTTLRNWKTSKYNQNGKTYTEPYTLDGFTYTMEQAGLNYDSDVLSQMWIQTQNYIAIGRPRAELTAAELQQHPEYCQFTDIKITDSFYYPAIWAWMLELTSGVDSRTFGGNQPIPRRQCIYVLWKLACTIGGGQELEAEVGGLASDVPVGAYWAKAVDWAIENGVTELNSDNSFNPEGNATRAMVTQFIYKLEQWMGDNDLTAGATMPFKDIPSGDIYYTRAVDWAIARGISSKYGAGLTLERDGKKDMTIPDGESSFPHICIKRGTQDLKFKGKGTVRVRYRRGSL